MFYLIGLGLIIDDVSGIAEEIALKSSWYNKHIPLGGADGIEPTIRMLDRVKEYLKEDGILYFAAHELGHTHGLCDEYNVSLWLNQNNKYGCPNGDSDGNGETETDLSQYPDGIYLNRVTGEDGKVYTGKVVKQSE